MTVLGLIAVLLFCPQLFPYPGQDPDNFERAPLVWIAIRALFGGRKS
jgi:hypothetical protein